MSLRNYILNGEGQLRTEATPEAQADFAAKNMSVIYEPNPLGPNWNYVVKSIANITTPPHYGICPGWGHGPGGGGVTHFQMIDRDFHDTRFPNNPARFMWLSWTTAPNPAPLSQGSGWEQGAANADGTPRHTPGFDYDWRITILEHGIKDCEELLGSWIGYSFFAMTGYGTSMPIRPQMMTGFANNDFLLHDLGVQVTVTDQPVEICGHFYVPPPPPSKVVNRNQFGMQFGIDTTCKTPCAIAFTGFKLCKWPGATDPTAPPSTAASQIKYLVEKSSASLQRLRIPFHTVES